MTDPRELLDAYAQEWPHYGDAKELAARKTFAALRAVLDLHKPSSRVIDQWTRCYECNDSNGDCVPWPCDTVQAITTALEGK